MSDLGKSSSGLFVGAFLGAMLIYACAFAGEAPSEDSPATGELHIEGGGITNLTLESEQGQHPRFSAPGEILTLPAGKYRLSEVALEGGYTCPTYLMPKEQGQWITVAPGQPATLKVGAPLRQVVRVERRARSMILNYELHGQAGERYVPATRSGPPTFVVYKGEREVASGDFEYG